MSEAQKNLKKVVDVYMAASPAERQQMQGDLHAAIANPYTEIPPEDSPGFADMVEPNIAAPIHAEHRAFIKNFDNSVQDSIHYLEQKYPNYEFGHNGRDIYAKLPGHDKFFPLDPNNMKWENNPINPHNWDMDHAKEFVQDATDGAWDAATAVPNYMASGVAALAAGATSPPLAIPTAMAVHGAIGGAADLVRQGIGEGLGVNQGIDYGQAGMAAGANAVLPAFATGVSGQLARWIGPEVEAQLRSQVQQQLRIPAQQVANMSKEEIINTLAKTGGYGGIFAKLGSAAGTLLKKSTAGLTSTTPEAVQTMADNPGVIMNDRTNLPPKLMQLRDMLNTANTKQGQAASNMIGAGLENSEGIDAKGILDHLDSKIKEGQARMEGMPDTMQQVYAKTLGFMAQKRDEIAHYAARNGGRLTPDMYNEFNQMLEDYAQTGSGNLPDAVAGVVARGNSRSAIAAKNQLNRSADDANALTEIGRQQYAYQKRGSDLLGQKVGESNDLNTGAVQSLVKDPLSKMDLDTARYTKLNMTPEEYGKFQGLYNDLHANTSYDQAQPFTQKSIIGLPASLAVKGLGAPQVMSAGAGVLRLGQAGAGAARAYGNPLIQGAVNENRQISPDTMDIMARLRALGLAN